MKPPRCKTDHCPFAQNLMYALFKFRFEVGDSTYTFTSVLRDAGISVLWSPGGIRTNIL